MSNPTGDMSSFLKQQENTNQDRNFRPFISPVRVLNGRDANQQHQQASSRDPPFCRKPTVPSADLENVNSVKRVIVFRKFLSKSPDARRIVENKHQAQMAKPLRIRDEFKNLHNREVVQQQQKAKISLNEMVTLKKIRTTSSNGVVKRMLHALTMHIYDVQVC